jgi:hypothetical protein
MATAAGAAVSAKKVDFIQQIYLDKIKEYAAKSKSGGIQQPAALAAQLKGEKEKLKAVFSRNPNSPETPDDVTKVPTFAFKDPNLKDVF